MTKQLLKIGTELALFGAMYKVAKISRKSVLFSLCEDKSNISKELELSLKEVEKQLSV